MKRCLNSPFYHCLGTPQVRFKLHYDIVTQPDGSTKRVWHRYAICSLEPYHCQLSKPCQLSLTTE